MEWRAIPGWRAYEVSEAGDVRRVLPSANFGCHSVSAHRSRQGYRWVTLYNGDGKRHVAGVHRLLALAFLGPPPSDAHKASFNDGNPDNIVIANISWRTKSENAREREQRRPRPLMALIGERFGRLVVVDELPPIITVSGSRQHRRRILRCVCDCGETTTAPASRLRGGRVRSCGCLRREMVAEAFTTHGDTSGRRRTTEYQCWKAMRSRCEDPSRKDFYLYGGRGIKVCDRWRDSFSNFLADMGRKPAKNLSIDRIDNEKGYEPGNCRWATAREQRLNQRPVTSRRDAQVARAGG